MQETTLDFWSKLRAVKQKFQEEPALLDRALLMDRGELVELFGDIDVPEYVVAHAGSLAEMLAGTDPARRRALLYALSLPPASDLNRGGDVVKLEEVVVNAIAFVNVYAYVNAIQSVNALLNVNAELNANLHMNVNTEVNASGHEVSGAYSDKVRVLVAESFWVSPLAKRLEALKLSDARKHALLEHIVGRAAVTEDGESSGDAEILSCEYTYRGISMDVRAARHKSGVTEVISGDCRQP